ncbi:MAG: SUMF1/EgtB/PvdO family nonheme iron enzyme [Myxococcota bacterium]
MARAAAGLAALLLLLAARGAAAQTGCGELDGSLDFAAPDPAYLREDLAGVAALDAWGVLRCDVRDETPLMNDPVDRSDPGHGCTVVDAVVMRRSLAALEPPLAPVCAVFGSQDCCAAHESVGCDELAVTTCVCDLEPRCCRGAWDSVCAAIACSGACAGVCRSTDEPQPNAGIVSSPAGPGCPDGMVAAGAVCIDRYEAFVEEYEPLNGTFVGPWSPYVSPTGHAVRAVSAAGARPQAFINANEAEDACQGSGKRLCSSVEWLRACRGPTSLTYPYGPTRIVGACNDERTTLPHYDYFGTDDPALFGDAPSHRCFNQISPGLADTGSHPLCAGVEGVFDMVGGLDEWVADAAGTFRGGTYVYDGGLNGPGCGYVTTAHDRNHRTHRTGFRCCADPP